jgi:hypothetical protein
VDRLPELKSFPEDIRFPSVLSIYSGIDFTRAAAAAVTIVLIRARDSAA